MTNSRPPAMEAAAAAFDTLRGVVADLRYRAAVARDDQLTEAEQIAALDVYEEFGR